MGALGLRESAGVLQRLGDGKKLRSHTVAEELGASIGDNGALEIGLQLGSAAGGPVFALIFQAILVLFLWPVLRLWGETGARVETSRGWIWRAFGVFFVVSFVTAMGVSSALAPALAQPHDNRAGPGHRSPQALLSLGSWPVWRCCAGCVSGSCGRPQSRTAGGFVVSPPSSSQVVISQPTPARDAGNGSQWQGGWGSLTGSPHGGSSPPDRR